MKQAWILLLLGGVGCWYIWRYYEVKGVEGLFSASGVGETQSSGQQVEAPPMPSGRTTLVIASFNANPLDAKKLGQPARLAALVQLLRRFDLVALQNIQLETSTPLLQLRDQLNAAGGRYYELALGPESFTPQGRPISVFFYDRAMVEIDLAKVYWVEDAQGRLSDRPLAALFRARGPHPSQAFTFTLVSLYIRPDRTQEELPVIEQVYRSIRKNFPGEDDLLLVGTFHADRVRLNQWIQALQLTWAVPTSTSPSGEGIFSDNILFPLRATVEYTGRSGMVDLVRELGLSVQEAMDLSDHCPIWAEFSIYEGGEPGGLVVRPVHRPR